MGVANQDAVRQLALLMEAVDEPLKQTFENMHQGYRDEAILRFLMARDGNVVKAHKMLLDCLNWRIDNEIDNILRKPILPFVFRSVRNSQLVGLSGYSREGLPIFAVGLGFSTRKKMHINHYVHSHIQLNEYRDRVVLPSATVRFGRYIGTCIKVLDMTGLNLSTLNQIKLLTVLSTIDDLNYPEKTDTYYIVNVPYIFLACWKVVKPLLKERTRKKIQVLHGSGKDELLQIMDYTSLPHFCKEQSSGSSKYFALSLIGSTDDCFSADHPFHQELCDYVRNQESLFWKSRDPIKEESFDDDIPEPDSDPTEIAMTIESEFQKNGEGNGRSDLGIVGT